MEMMKAQANDRVAIEAFYKLVSAYQIARNEKQWDEADVTWDALTSIYSLSDFYLMKDDGVIVAACLIVDFDPIYWPKAKKAESLYLHKIAVHPKYRHRGIGDEVVRFFIKQGKLAKLSEVRLDVRANKQKLRHFYERNGFTLVRMESIFKNYDTALYRYQLEDEDA